MPSLASCAPLTHRALSVLLQCKRLYPSLPSFVMIAICTLSPVYMSLSPALVYASLTRSIISSSVSSSLHLARRLVLNLIVQHTRNQRTRTARHSVRYALEAAYGVVAVHCAAAVLVEAAEDVEGVVGKESACSRECWRAAGRWLVWTWCGCGGSGIGRCEQ